MELKNESNKLKKHGNEYTLLQDEKHSAKKKSNAPLPAIDFSERKSSKLKDFPKKNDKSLSGVLLTDFPNNDLMVKNFLPFFSTFELSQVGRTNQFFLAGAKARSEESWQALVKEKFSDYPVPQIKKQGSIVRTETFKEMYQRLHEFCVELHEELISIASTSNFFEAATKADNQESWCALFQEKFFATPVFAIKKDKEDRCETYEELHKRLQELCAKPREKKGVPGSNRKYNYKSKKENRVSEIFASIVRHGLDKFEQYFPLRPININQQLDSSYANQYILLAVDHNQPKFVYNLIDFGADANAKGWGVRGFADGEPGRDSDLGYTPLILAAARGHLVCLKVLLECYPGRVNINQQCTPDLDHVNEFALNAASRAGHTKCVEYLLERGASINLRSRCMFSYESPLSCAANEECRQLIRAKMTGHNEHETESCCLCVIL